MGLPTLLEQTFSAALAALDPRSLVDRAIGSLALEPPVTLIAIGKAALRMGEGASRVASSGLCIVRDPAPHTLPRGIEVFPAAHPTPDARSLAAGEKLLRLVEATRQGTILLLVSGGASALACLPAAGVPLADKLAATKALSDAGASIAELNALRKHLSQVKGGRLLAAAGTRVVALVLSDVLGDDPTVIGSGLAGGDRSTFGETLDLCRRYRVELPASVRQRLEAGARRGAGAPEETPRPDDPRLARHHVEVLAGPDDLLREAAGHLHSTSVHVDHVEPRVADPVESLAARLAARAQALAWRTRAGETRAELAGGEPTIRLPRDAGRGGRAQHTALLVAARFADMRWPDGTEVALLAAGSDGSDGPTDAAGAIVNPATQVDPAAIEAFDAHTALAANRFSPGPTGSNLGDLFVVVARRPPD